MRYMFFLAGSVIYGQALSVSSPTATAGMPVVVDISLQGAGNATQPSALEWTITYPAADLAITTAGPTVDPELRDAGKFLTCRGGWEKGARIYSYRCMLAGGKEPIREGTVASLHFQVKRTAKPGPRPFELANPKAVTAAAKPMHLTKANGVLAIAAAQ